MKSGKALPAILVLLIAACSGGEKSRKKSSPQASEQKQDSSQNAKAPAGPVAPAPVSQPKPQTGTSSTNSQGVAVDKDGILYLIDSFTPENAVTAGASTSGRMLLDEVVDASPTPTITPSIDPAVSSMEADCKALGNDYKILKEAGCIPPKIDWMADFFLKIADKDQDTFVSQQELLDFKLDEKVYTPEVQEKITAHKKAIFEQYAGEDQKLSREEIIIALKDLRAHVIKIRKLRHQHQRQFLPPMIHCIPNLQPVVMIIQMNSAGQGFALHEGGGAEASAMIIKKYDQDGDGKLSPEELVVFLQERHQNLMGQWQQCRMGMGPFKPMPFPHPDHDHEEPVMVQPTGPFSPAWPG